MGRIAVGIGILLIVIGVVAASYNGLTHRNDFATGAISLILAAGFGCPGAIALILGLFLTARNRNTDWHDKPKT